MHSLAHTLRTLLLAAAMMFSVTSLSVASQTALAETVPIHPGPLAAQFRGCDSAGWCRFRIESLSGVSPSLHRVYPDGILRKSDEDYSKAVRNRLNALLVNMIHQYKRIELRKLRSVGDGLFAAIVTVDGNDVAADRILLELQGKTAGNPR